MLCLVCPLRSRKILITGETPASGHQDDKYVRKMISKSENSVFGQRFKEVCRGGKAWRDFISRPTPRRYLWG